MPSLARRIESAWRNNKHGAEIERQKTLALEESTELFGVEPVEIKPKFVPFPDKYEEEVISDEGDDLNWARHAWARTVDTDSGIEIHYYEVPTQEITDHEVIHGLYNSRNPQAKNLKDLLLDSHKPDRIRALRAKDVDTLTSLTKSYVHLIVSVEYMAYSYSDYIKVLRGAEPNLLNKFSFEIETPYESGIRSEINQQLGELRRLSRVSNSGITWTSGNIQSLVEEGGFSENIKKLNNNSQAIAIKTAHALFIDYSQAPEVSMVIDKTGIDTYAVSVELRYQSLSTDQVRAKLVEDFHKSPVSLAEEVIRLNNRDTARELIYIGNEARIAIVSR